MNLYSEYTQTQFCPILADFAILKDTDHPKKIILIKTGGDVPRAFDTLLLWKWVTEGRKTNSLTNLDLCTTDLERIEFYKESLDRYPEITLSQAKQLVQETLSNFFQTGEGCTAAAPQNPGEADEVAPSGVPESKLGDLQSCEAPGLYFSDVEDFQPYIFAMPTGQSFRTSANQVMSLFKDSKFWILRKTSLVDSPGEHEHYGISDNTGHFAIRHSFGQGYWQISGDNGKDVVFLSPSFMGALRKMNKSLRNLVYGSNNNGRIQLHVLRT